MKINELLNEDWNKVNHHDKTNGLSRKAVNAYRREHPGSKLQTAVTTKPSKLKAGSKAAKRRKSFCARMSGNKGPMKKPNGKPTPKALALRRWNCESIDEMAQMIAEGTRMIAELKKGAKDSNGFTKCWPGKHAEGTKKGKNGGQVRNCVPNEGMAEGSRDQVDPNTVWEVSFDYGPHQSDKVKVRAGSQEEAEQKGMRAAKKLGHRFPQLNWAMPADEGVTEAAKHGLYYNVNKRKAAGTSRPASSPKAPTAQAWKDAAKTAKK